MKNQLLPAAVLLMVTFFSMPSLSAQTKKQLSWFENQEWLQGSEFSAIPSVDVETFAKHYAKYPEHWQLVFDYPANSDINTLPLGLKVLSDDVKVN